MPARKAARQEKAPGIRWIDPGHEVGGRSPYRTDGMYDVLGADPAPMMSTVYLPFYRSIVYAPFTPDAKMCEFNAIIWTILPILGMVRKAVGPIHHRRRAQSGWLRDDSVRKSTRYLSAAMMARS